MSEVNAHKKIKPKDVSVSDNSANVKTLLNSNGNTESALSYHDSKKDCSSL